MDARGTCIIPQNLIFAYNNFDRIFVIANIFTLMLCSMGSRV